MFDDVNMKRQTRQPVPTLLKVGACIVLVLCFYASASATSPLPPSAAAIYSTVQRSAPSASRTPTLTPAHPSSARLSAPDSAQVVDTIPGQPTVDQYTVALYHFDAPTGNNQVIDATGRYTGTLNGAAIVTTTTQLYGGMLQVDGLGSYVRTGHFDNYDLSQGTVEAYVDFVAACAANHDDSIISAGGEYGGSGPVLKLTGRDGLAFWIWVTDHWVYANSGINECRYLTGAANLGFPYDPVRFHHVAGTWGPRGVEIWVDGVLHGVGNSEFFGPNSQPYRCSPQEQFGITPAPPNPYAPYYCQTPVMYPTMSSFPPGDYTGGIPPYSTFLIGCESTGACFDGGIDEVRISNIQRKFTIAVVPTNTPTVTPTPVTILGEYPVDPYTLALYHFNTTISPYLTWEEVSQNYSQLSGQAAIVPGGRFNTGLYLDGNQSYIGGMPNLGSPWRGTVEAWVNFAPGAPPVYRQIFAVTKDNLGQFTSFGVASQQLITFSVGDQSITIPMTPANLAGCWHHLAGTWGPRGLEIWLDGILAASNPGLTGGIPQYVVGWRVGCDYTGGCVNGRLDEVRISNIQRVFTNIATFPVRARPSSLRQEFSAASPDGNLTFLPMIDIAPTPACPFGS